MVQSKRKAEIRSQYFVLTIHNNTAIGTFFNSSYELWYTVGQLNATG